MGEGSAYEMYSLARMILEDQCPPDNRMYLCKMCEDDCCDCNLCWSRYLLYVLNGKRGDPYKWDRIKYQTEVI